MKRRDLIFCVVTVLLAGAGISAWLKRERLDQPKTHDWGMVHHSPNLVAVEKINAALAEQWRQAGVQPLPEAPPVKIARRLSLGLAGTVPSIEEIRTFEQQPADQQIQWWLSHLFESKRCHDYLAERLARSYVGIDEGPFLVYRRRRFTSWLSDQLQQNRPYHQLARELIAGEGIWTSNPAVNFVTATVDQNEEKGPDEIKLAGRVARAFLGVRMDCMQCHDDQFGDRWKQQHFHELAAFFHPAELTISGVRQKNEDGYQYTYHGEKDAVVVPTGVPFYPELLPVDGAPRQRLAKWVTHPDNEAFARATVNRTWALLFGKPLMEPIDNVPIEGPWPPVMTVLADDFRSHGFDLRRLIRLIAESRAFRADSAAPADAEPPTAEQETAWAAFPMTRLRPDQIAGSMIQATSLKTIDAESHILVKLGRFTEQNEFVKRYGDAGEDEFGTQAGTIPQRLLMMNGKLMHERIKDNLFVNAAPQLTAVAAKKPDLIVETAYLGVFGRRPSEAEAAHFVSELSGLSQKAMHRAVADLFWTLMNTTEFAWNH
jgi:hypothetical protein